LVLHVYVGTKYIHTKTSPFVKALQWKHASDTSVYFWIQFEGKQLYIKSKLFISVEIS